MCYQWIVCEILVLVQYYFGALILARFYKSSIGTANNNGIFVLGHYFALLSLQALVLEES